LIFGSLLSIIIMRQKQIRFVVLLGAFAIIGIISIQVYFLQNVWNIKEKQFVQSVMIGLRNVAEQMGKYNQTSLPYVNPIRQLSSNYFVVDINSVIDANILEFYLKAEFDKLNLQTDFEYAIYNCQTDKMEYGNYLTKSGNAKPNVLTANLPKYDQYTYYFGVNFPLLRNTITGDMTIWFFFMALLLVAIIFFVYAIFVILHQKRLSEMQKDFINNMTHEFKTPISSINISADVIMNPDIIHDPARLFTYGSVIKQENNRLNQQVDKVLQIARIESHSFHLNKEQIDLNTLILKVAENCKANSNRNMVVNTNLYDSLDLIEADSLHLTNIFHNLLDNASKYSDKEPIIAIETKCTDKSVIITISDNGPGISPEYQRRIFQKFYRIPTGNLHDVKGFGLGLYYVKTICDAHQWEIRLISDRGMGATFEIEIPLKKKGR
jgi:two-component system, OmpR family, phosphate regulon sensor histidine kinase PhoR